MKSLCKSIVSFLVIFSCTALYSMEKDKKIFLWDKNSIEKIISKKDEHSLYAKIQDDAGQTPLLFLIVNNTYKDSYSHSCGIYREYTYNPNLLKKFITITDLNTKNSENKNFVDYLLSHIETYRVNPVDTCNKNVKFYIGSDYPYTSSHSSTKTDFYELFQWLLGLTLKSGYSFFKNPQTTLELLPSNFDSIFITEYLLRRGISCGPTFNYFERNKIRKLRYKCKKYDTNTQNSEKLKRLLEQENDPDFLLLLFHRAVSRNQSILLRLFNQEVSNIFTPLYALKVAIEFKSHVSIYYILQSFSPLTLYNLLERMGSKKPTLITLKAKFDEELYKSCQEAESSGYHIFCNKVAAIAALRCYRKNKRYLPPEIIAHILEYMDL